MEEKIIGEIRLFTFDYEPAGWLFCDGKQLPVNQYPDLFATLGNRFGGIDGFFNIPDLRERSIVGTGSLSETSIYGFAETGGEEINILNINEIPQHSHNIIAGSAISILQNPIRNFWGVTRYSINLVTSEKNANSFASTDIQNDILNKDFIEISGKNLPHENRQPYLTLNFCIYAGV